MRLMIQDEHAALFFDQTREECWRSAHAGIGYLKTWPKESFHIWFGGRDCVCYLMNQMLKLHDDLYNTRSVRE